jgi:hypothetical protein
MKPTSQIGGWFDYPQVFDFLLQEMPENGVFVEGGAWLGKSSSYLCDKAAEIRPNAQIFIVDTWKGSVNELETFHKLAVTNDVYAMFLENMGERKFTPIRKTSLEAAPDFADNSIDVMFIDMEHTLNAVRADIRAWFPKVKPGGWMAGHDYGTGWPDVVKAVDGSFPKGVVKKRGSCWTVRKTEDMKLRD